MFYFSKKVRLFSQNDVLFLFYFLINPAMTTEIRSNVQLHMLCAFDLINWDFFIGWFTFQNKKHMVSGKWLTWYC